MKKMIWSAIIVTTIILVIMISKLLFLENSATRLLKSIGEVREIKVFTLPSNGENELFATQDPRLIQEFLDGIEFKRFSQTKAYSIKKPATLEFVTVGIATQRLQWVEIEWGYLRADNGLLYGDVALTESSSQQLSDWCKAHGIVAPERSTPPKWIK